MSTYQKRFAEMRENMRREQAKPLSLRSFTRKMMDRDASFRASLARVQGYTFVYHNA